MLDCLYFDDFWDSKNLRQANHMHMHMFCLLVSFEISEIVEIENSLLFLFSHRFCTWPIFAPKVNYAYVKFSEEIWKYSIFSILTISDSPRMEDKQIICICICFARLSSSRCRKSSTSRKMTVLNSPERIWTRLVSPFSTPWRFQWHVLDFEES